MGSSLSVRWYSRMASSTAPYSLMAEARNACEEKRHHPIQFNTQQKNWRFSGAGSGQPCEPIVETSCRDLVCLSMMSAR